MADDVRTAGTSVHADVAVVGPVLVLNPDNTVTTLYGKVTLRGAARVLYVQNPDNTLIIETAAADRAADRPV